MSGLVSSTTGSKLILEETANQITHAIGLVLSVIGTFFLLKLARGNENDWQVFGCAVYGTSLVALYSASTLSHSFQKPRLKHFFRTLDQVCIFFLIAGSFTPLALTLFLDSGWLFLLIAMWILAIIGSFFKVVVTRQQNVTVWAYALLGWLPVLAIKPIAEQVTTQTLFCILAGGVLYTVGTLFLALDDRIPYFHAVWHVLVVTGSTCHFFANWYVVAN